MSQTGTQMITMNVLSDISKSKGNKTMKFGQLLKSNMRNIFVKNYAENRGRKLNLDLFLLVKTALFKRKVSG